MFATDPDLPDSVGITTKITKLLKGRDAGLLRAPQFRLWPR